MQNRTNNDTHLTLVRIAIIRKDLTSGGEDKEKSEPLCTVGRNVNGYSHYEDSIYVPQNTENRSSI